MDKPLELTPPPSQRPWDARLARWLVAPLKDSRVTPNHLTTLRLAVGLAGAAAFTPGTYGWVNLGALLLSLSNFLDHADGELARMTGKGSRLGHFYDLASDALITILLFVAMAIGSSASMETPVSVFGLTPAAGGTIAGVAVAWIFLLRMRIEEMTGKAGIRQARLGGFETEDVLYLLPLVTLCNVVGDFLKVAAVGAPLFAVWVTVDYRRTLQRCRPGRAPRPSLAPAPLAEVSLPPEARPSATAMDTLKQQFSEQGAFIQVRNFAGDALVARLVSAVAATRERVNRNYIPGHKQGGSVSRHTLEQYAPSVGELYRSPGLIDWLSALCGERLQPAPVTDPHAFALYFYTRSGDHIGWHYDNSYYAGRRYTLLLGIIDDSSCQLEYELHTRDPGGVVERNAVHLAPGDLVFFDGDRLRHRITPLKDGEYRVALTFEFVTDPSMHPWWRFVSNMKDAVAYFGFRQVFGPVMNRTRRG